jgi:oxalate---CoA ligase
VEQILYRLGRFPPPPHLADLVPCDVLENQGRQRCHRYYTLTGYLDFIRNEKIDDAGRTSRYTSMDVSQSGGFYCQPDHVFYKDFAALVKYEDEYKHKGKPPKEAPPRKIGRPRKDDSKPSQGATVKTTSLAADPPRKGIRTVTVQQDDRDHAHPARDNIASKGTKRKRREKPELGASNSELQLPPKKKQAVQKNSAPDNGPLTDPMNLNGATAVELPGHSRSEILGVSRVEDRGSPGIRPYTTGT